MSQVDADPTDAPTVSPGWHGRHHPGARGSLVHLRAAGVSVLLDIPADGLPALTHWGADLGPLGASEAVAAVAARVPVVSPNTVDAPQRLALLPEAHRGHLGRPGLSGSRDGRDWSPRFTVTDVTVDEAALRSAYREAGPATVRCVATDQRADLSLRLEVELTASGLLRTRAGLTNDGDDTYQLHDLVLALPVPASATELLDLAGTWSAERVPQRREFTVGTHLREGRRGRTGPDAATVLHAAEPGFGFRAGQIWAIHTAWSGNHTTYAEATATGARVLGGGELLLPGEVRLGPGQDYLSPWLYGSWGLGLDAVAARFHRHLRARPRHVDTARPVTLNVWEAVYFDHDLDRLRELARIAGEVGVERFVLDDGWFSSRRDDTSGLGDWVVSPRAWPGGLDPLVDAVHAAGMQFGLWVEPEMVNLDSDLARAHPEWIMSAGPDLPLPSRHQHVLNLSDPDCYSHIRDQLVAVLSQHDIGYLKWDHNRDLVEAGDRRRQGRPAVHAQTLATYRLMDELRQRFPGLEIESCSSGGARVDLAVIEHTDRVWVSDCIDPLERQRIMRWSVQLLPPELLGSHIASTRSHTTGRRHDLAFRAATAFFGHLGIEWDLTAASPLELHELSAWVAAYRTHRDLLLAGDVVRVDTAEHTLVHGVVSADRRDAIFALVRLASLSAEPAEPLRLAGLDPQQRYELAPMLPNGSGPSGWTAPPWADGVVLPGSILERVGLAQPRLQPEQAVLLRVRAVGDGEGAASPTAG